MKCIKKPFTGETSHLLVFKSFKCISVKGSVLGTVGFVSNLIISNENERFSATVTGYTSWIQDKITNGASHSLFSLTQGL